MLSPTFEGFVSWVRTVMGIPLAALPDDSPFLLAAYTIALEIVSPSLQVRPAIHTLAVYNLGGDNLLNWAPDQANSSFFADARESYKIFNFVAGVVASTGDQGTSTSLAVPEGLRELTLAQLQNTKTPYGRQYLAFAQSLGPNVWGIS